MVISTYRPQICHYCYQATLPHGPVLCNHNGTIAIAHIITYMQALLQKRTNLIVNVNYNLLQDMFLVRYVLYIKLTLQI